jgi:Trp operon repressor
MPHVSLKKLDDKYFAELYSQLIKVFNTAGSSYKSDELMKEILTETEKVMLTKRLVMVCMLYEGISQSFIADTLLASPSTVERVALKYEIGRFKYLSHILHKNEKTIFSILEEFIRNSVLAQTGKRRMRWMEKIEQKYKKPIFKS